MRDAVYTFALAAACAGGALMVGAYIWSFVLASRVGIVWFLGLFFLGIVVYPVLVHRRWPMMRINFFAFIGGLGVLVVGLTLLAATRR